MNKKIISSLELGRVVAIFAILAMHCGMFYSYFQFNEEPWFAYIFNQLTRFGVPLFFLLAGFFVQPKLATAPLDTLKQYSKPLVRIWVVWSAISLLFPFQWHVVMQNGYLAERKGYWGYLGEAPLNSLLEGGLVHLWFIPALIMAVGLIALLNHYKQTRLLLPIAVVLYIYGVLAGSYVVVTDLPSPFFTRNGPFFATLMVAIGYLIRQNEFTLKSKTAAAIAVLGLLIHFGEAFALDGYDAAFNAHDYLFGTALWATGLFLWLLNHPDLGNNKVVHYLGKRVLAIYVSHIIFIIAMQNVAGMYGFQGPMGDLVVFGGTVVITLLFVAIVERTPLQKWLIR
ncbi:acyltransferase [Vibrio sonorensis]|uniref:acyltransferase n=1 Tax=Vibrio sonorensis TaxID=1004316 RepID=UPI0008D94EBF|nr:acyltransferase family protein [Vibrio sonorensis]